MKRVVTFFMTLVLALCVQPGFASAQSAAPQNYVNSAGNVSFDAMVYGAENTSAPILTVRLKRYDPETDQKAISLFNDKIFKTELSLQVVEEQQIGGRICSRTYGTAEDIAREHISYFFYDGTIGAITYESTWYYGMMDITSMLDYDGACYVEDRTVCGDLPMMTTEQVRGDMKEIMGTFAFNTENDPFILRAYSLDDAVSAQPGIHPLMEMVIQGVDLLEENRKIVSSAGPNSYFIAYRYVFENIPVTYSYFYIESQDFSTITSNVQGLYNDTGLVRFIAYNEFEVQEKSETYALIPFDAAAEVVSTELNQLIGVEPFICKEISLEYVPLAYSGGDIEREARLVPMWVFYFEDLNVAPILIDATSGKVIN